MAETAPSLEDLLTRLADRIVTASSPSLLVRQELAPALLGVSRAAFFRLKSEPSFPRPVAVKGAGVVYRRSDLLKWAEKLKPARC